MHTHSRLTRMYKAYNIYISIHKQADIKSFASLFRHIFTYTITIKMGNEMYTMWAHSETVKGVFLLLLSFIFLLLLVLVIISVYFTHLHCRRRCCCRRHRRRNFITKKKQQQQQQREKDIWEIAWNELDKNVNPLKDEHHIFYSSVLFLNDPHLYV